MNLKNIQEWASKIDLLVVDEKKRHHAKCYKDMIAEKTGMINMHTAKIEKYMKDINEYVEQLAKIGLSMKPIENKVEEVVSSFPTESSSPLLP